MPPSKGKKRRFTQHVNGRFGGSTRPNSKEEKVERSPTLAADTDAVIRSLKEELVQTKLRQSIKITWDEATVGKNRSRKMRMMRDKIDPILSLHMDSAAQQAYNYIEERWQEIEAGRNTGEEDSKEVGGMTHALRTKIEKIIVAQVSNESRVDEVAKADPVQAFVRMRSLPKARLKKYVADTKVVLDAKVEAVNAVVKRIDKFWSTSKALQIKTDLLLSENKYNQLRHAMS